MMGSQAPAPLVDDFGREVTGIRVSLTDRCNFDCVYCHNEGLGDTRGPMAPRDGEMDAADVVRLLEVVQGFGVEAVKFTGGEPLLREDLEAIVRGVPEDMAVSLTTNGSLLPDRAEALADAGLERVNVSQDALEPESFRRLTQSGAYEQVLAGVEAAVDAGLDPVKLNMVVFEDTAGYVPRMVEYVARADALRLQLIEYMPEIAGNPEWAVDVERVHDWLAEQAHRIEQREMHGRTRYWIRAGVVDGDGVDELADRIGSGTSGASGTSSTSGASGTSSTSGASGTSSTSGASGVSDVSEASDGVGMVEIVDPVGNADFCANCHRVRVTPEGEFKGCLNRTDDYRSTGDMTKAEIREAYRETVAERVPYYGEYMVETEEGWERNEDYVS